ncbi:MAG: hypothetical protein D6706_03800 [Chloroflexi bacterium]|nr:MAG: hypothetical protein D6706_03800 [Chloroflexota bacterium]
MKFKSLFFLFLLFTAAILITNQSPKRQTATAQANDQLIYMPVINSGYDTDLIISSLEITQAVQKADNSVPLVGSKPTIVRVYAQTIAGTPPSGVKVSLTAARNNTLLGTITSTAKIVPKNPQRSDYSSTFNLQLPDSWLSGTVEITATVDVENIVLEYKGNNNYNATLVFNSVPPLDVKIVPINYTHNPTGAFFPGQQQDRISDYLKRTYPVPSVNVSFRGAYNFQGDLRNGNDWVQLLYDVTDLKQTDNAPNSQVYYGLVPIENGATQWFFGGIAGIGWVGWRASVALNLSQSSSGPLAAHEIGHNFGRNHAPCGNPAGVDASYPYAGASIGEYGVDVLNGQLLLPSQYVDMMSYCSPEWVSDYTYQALYNDQLVSGKVLSQARVDGLMIRVRMDEDGRPVLQPVYALTHTPFVGDVSDEYAVELLDVTGEVVGRYPLFTVLAEEEGVSARMWGVSVPMPDVALGGVRVVAGKTAVSERVFTPAAFYTTATPVLKDTADSLVLSWPFSAPTLVRYTIDDGQTWITYALAAEGELVIEKENLPAENGRFQLIPADTTHATLTLDYNN